MYWFTNKEAIVKYRQSAISKEIGLAQPTISRIINHKVGCSKMVAYCITKFINRDSEIKDYFEFIEKGE